MLIYSNILTRADLDAIAAQMPITLFETDDEFYGARRRRIKVSLRPMAGRDPQYDPGERWRKVKVDQFTGRERRVFAVSWDGHYVFYAAVLALDPNAEIKSVLAHWRGADDFYARVDFTGNQNWGSAHMPQYAREMAHVPQSSSTLRMVGERIASRVKNGSPYYRTGNAHRNELTDPPKR